ncbi:MAG: 5'/3'-nucleotidase SurE [Clostridia bacterium]|nr:5'/3'-nucleotidase SurE [Clostridia bacterium]
MKILLSNDDGVHAEGLRVLAEALYGEHTLCVSAPDRERSAVSRSMTLFSPLRARACTLPGLPDVRACAVTGTPVDCVRLGVGNLFGRPDMLLSGINHGGNLGTDTLYSGTVAAAHEAALLGIQAAAISCCSHAPKHLETAAIYARRALRYLSAHPLPVGGLLNVNVPDLPPEEIRGVKLAPVGIEEYALSYVEREDPVGVPYYWAPRGRLTDAAGQDVDVRWVQEGYVVFTPLTYDLTDRASLASMREAELD